MADPIQAQAPMTPRMKALQNLSNSLPVANSQVAAGQAAARDMQLQQAVKKAAPTTNIPQAAQQTAESSAQAASQQMIQRAQDQVKQQGQVGQMGLAEQQQQSQSNVAGLQGGAKQQEMDNLQKFADVSAQAKKEMFDDQMKFQKDEQGRTLFNERQLADYAKLNAENDQEYRNYAQNAEQLNKRKLQTMEAAYKVAMQDLQHKQAIAEQKKDQQAQLEINYIRKSIEEQMAKEKAKAANRTAAFQTGGAIIGGVAGGVFGGPAGAMAGASAGSAVGGIAASQTA